MFSNDRIDERPQERFAQRAISDKTQVIEQSGYAIPRSGSIHHRNVVVGLIIGVL
jgi:hypothetical protein